MAKPASLHANNRFAKGYDLHQLALAYPPLKAFIIQTINKTASINFALPQAVLALNTALLKSAYQINDWQLPANALCPGVPGRLDYLHYLADLLAEYNDIKLTENKKIKALDIGTGASAIYPILGVVEYAWQFVASDISAPSLANVNKIIANNTGLQGQIDCRLQADKDCIFHGIIQANEYFTFTLSNPPFHRSQQEASQGSIKKQQNLMKAAKGKEQQKSVKTLNFGGQNAELWCEGGEVKFIRNMIRDSKAFRSQVLWFTSLVSKKDSLSALKLSLKKAKVSQIKILKMVQGQKVTRVICWSFLSPSAQQLWVKQHLS